MSPPQRNNKLSTALNTKLSTKDLRICKIFSIFAANLDLLPVSGVLALATTYHSIS